MVTDNDKNNKSNSGCWRNIHLRYQIWFHDKYAFLCAINKSIKMTYKILTPHTHVIECGNNAKYMLCNCNENIL